MFWSHVRGFDSDFLSWPKLVVHSTYALFYISSFYDLVYESCSTKNSKPLLTRRKDVLSQDIVKSRSREIQV